MRTNGTRKTSCLKRIQENYRLIMGYRLVNHGQDIMDSSGRIVFDCHHYPSQEFMCDVIHMFDQIQAGNLHQMSLDQICEEAKDNELRREYRKALDLRFDTKLNLINRECRLVHTAGDYPSQDQMIHIIWMKRAEREVVVASLIKATSRLSYEKKLMAEHTAQEKWWDDHISERMDFLLF